MSASAKPSRAPRARRREASMSSKHAALSRRTVLQSGLAGGLVLGFQWPLRGSARQRAGAACRQSERPVRAERLHPHRQHRQDDIGHPAGRDGAGGLHRDRHDPRRRTRLRLREGRARTLAAERQALRQSDVRHSGHRQFQLDPRVLGQAAPGRRLRARDAGRGRRRAVAGRCRKLRRCQRQGHPCREQPHAHLRRACRCRRQAAGAGQTDAERSERFRA